MTEEGKTQKEYTQTLIDAGLPEDFSKAKIAEVFDAVGASGLSPKMTEGTIDKGIKKFVGLITSSKRFEGTCVGAGEITDVNQYMRRKALDEHKANAAAAIKGGKVRIDPGNGDIIPLHSEKTFKSGSTNFNFGKEILEKFERTLYFLIDGEVISARGVASATVGNTYIIFGKQGGDGGAIYLTKNIPVIDTGVDEELRTTLKNDVAIDIEELDNTFIGTTEIIAATVRIAKIAKNDAGFMMLAGTDPDIAAVSCFTDCEAGREDIANGVYEAGDDVLATCRISQGKDKEGQPCLQFNAYGIIKDEGDVDKDALAKIGALFG